MAINNTLKRDEEELIQRKRLLYDGHGTGEEKKLLALMTSITKLFLIGQTNEEFEKLQSNILKEITTVELATDRHLKISARCDRSIRNVERAIENQEKEIDNVKSELARLHLELEYVDRLKKVSEYLDLETIAARYKEAINKRDNLANKAKKYKEHLMILVDSCTQLEKLLVVDPGNPNDLTKGKRDIQ